ncbi:ankyrin repeat domain-containing 17, partial [Brachionus plicatilis]
MDIEKLNKLKPRNRNSTNAARNKLTTKKTKFVLCAQPSDKNNNLERLNSKLNSNFIQKLSLNQADEDNEISQIESFVFNEDEPQNVQELDEDNNDDDDDDEDDDDEDDEDDDDDDGLNLLKNRPKTYAQIDNDTKLKLETLLANAGIESITSDLFKDPQIMQTLTTTYVRTLNEVVAKTKLKKSVSKSKSETKSINEVVESTFEEFILAAAAVAAASSSSNSTMSNNGDEDDDELTEADIQHHNYMIQKLDKSDSKSDKKSDKKSVTSSASSSSSSLKQTINSCIGNLTSPESLLNKLIDLKPDLANSDKEAIDALTQVANKKIAVGKSLTELLEENADSVLGLACASGYLELVSVLLAINSNSNLDTVSKSKIKNESTPLIEACSNGHEQIVELLLKHGANPNKKSSSGSSPLHYAIQNQHANIVKKLAETCKDAILIEQTNENGHTPLMEAASNGFLDCAKILVDIGQANVNTYSAEFKETALTLASYK